MLVPATLLTKVTSRGPPAGSKNAYGERPRGGGGVGDGGGGGAVASSRLKLISQSARKADEVREGEGSYAGRPYTGQTGQVGARGAQIFARGYGTFALFVSPSPLPCLSHSLSALHPPRPRCTRTQPVALKALRGWFPPRPPEACRRRVLCDGSCTYFGVPLAMNKIMTFFVL